MKKGKVIIYQTVPRLFGNMNDNPTPHGSIDINGCGKFASYSVKALDSIRDLGVTHVWFTGVPAHTTRTDYSRFGIPKDHNAIVKGKAGSPFAIRDYYDVDPDLAENINERMNEFEALVKRTHDAGLKVIIDFVPNHVARDYCSRMKPFFLEDLGQNDDRTKAFLPTNNFYYLPGQNLELHFGAKQEDFEYSEFPARVTGNDCFSASPSKNDWYETVKLNYGVDYLNGCKKHFSPVPDTWNKMLDILLFWIGKDVDGFRCDMAEMVPVDFWQWVIPRIKSRKNVCFIAEVYNPALYRDYIGTGKFDYLYDKVGMYDTMRSIVCRQASTINICSCREAIEDFRENMLFFLENHDEQRIASDFFAANAFAGIPAFAFMALLNVNPIMIYNGQELGERGMDEEGFSGRDGRTTIFDYWSMPSIRRWANNGAFDGGQSTAEELTIRNLYKRILNIARDEKAISQGLFYGVGYCNHNNPYYPVDKMAVGLRKFEDELIIIIANFDVLSHSVRVNIPADAFKVMNIPDNKAAVMTNMFTGEESIVALTPVCPFEATVDAQSVKIYKISLTGISEYLS
ncbi:MAG: alpha-amylase family protein [Tannerella sp.]|nr:alpha-amylase family protein [Tannerella sp.]